MRSSAPFLVFLVFRCVFAGVSSPIFGYLPLLSGQIRSKWASGRVLDQIFVNFWWIWGPKISKKSTKIGICSRSALQVFFASLNLHLKLIFASTSEPANLDFEATLWHFFMFFRFSEDRVENDFKVIFYLPKAQKNTPKSTKSGPESSKKQHRKNIWFFYIFLAKIASKLEPKIDEKSIKMGGARWVNRFFKAEVTPKIDFERSKPYFESPGCHFGSILEPLGAILDQKI